MERRPYEIVRKAVESSNEFEKMTADIKREYIVSNIILYNAIVREIAESKGSFGTGYPFYVLDKDLKGAIPVIEEQLRYNNELLEAVDAESMNKENYIEWRCATCLREKGSIMPDLKQICKTCPEIANALKPRKVINRLPDLDMWMICDKDKIAEGANILQTKLLENGFRTSDVDPVQTIFNISTIVEDLQKGNMPDKKLPIDTHIIDNVTLYELICEIPDKLDYCFRKDEIPYLPIHPLSLRKTWQKDDVAYNFVHDYLSSFTDFDIDKDIKAALDETRKYVANKYSLDTLYKFLLQTGPDSVARRHKTPGLKEAFEKRIDSWKE